VRQRHATAATADSAAPAAGVATWLDARLETVEENLALDEALLEEAHEGLATAPVVRTWMADKPVVVVGSSSRVEEEVDLDACAAVGAQIVRRPSGGLTVVLGPGCLMWSVVDPHPEGAPAIDAIHARMLDPLCAALVGAGRRVVRRGSSDLVVAAEAGDERKCSGNALRVRRHGVLYHGTLLDTFDLGLISRVLRHPPREPEYRARRPHAAFLTNLHLGRETLEAVVRQAFATACLRSTWPCDRVARLVRERYGREEWTRRL